jgi:hypothetical protein
MALAVMQFQLFVFSEENGIANVIFAFGVNFVVFQLQLKIVDLLRAEII